jgi:hypothetical protein
MTPDTTTDERLAAVEAELERQRAHKTAEAALALPVAPKPTGVSAELQAHQEKARQHRAAWGEQQAAELEAWTERNAAKIEKHQARTRELQDAISAEDERHAAEITRLSARLAEIGRSAPRPPEAQPCPPPALGPILSDLQYAVHPSILARARSGR